MIGDDKQYLIEKFTYKIKNGISRGIPSNNRRFSIPFIYGICLGFLITLFLSIVHDPNYSEKQKLEHDHGRSNEQLMMAHVPRGLNVAELLFIEVKVYCIVVFRNLEEPKKKITYLSGSWTKRCNKVKYVIIKGDKFLQMEFEMNGVVQKVSIFPSGFDIYKELLKSENFDDFDWFLFAPESSYIVLENLRYMLYQYEASWPIFLAHNSTIMRKTLAEMHVISKTTLLKISENCMSNDQLIFPKMYDCLVDNKVKFINSTDSDNRETIFLKDPQKYIFPVESPNFNETRVATCCSKYLIALHEVYGVDLFRFDYYIYRVYAFGIVKNSENFELPEKLNSKTEVVNYED